MWASEGRYSQASILSITHNSHSSRLTGVPVPCLPSADRLLVQGSYTAFRLSAYWWNHFPEPKVHQQGQEWSRKFSTSHFEAVGAFVPLTGVEATAGYRLRSYFSE